MSNATDLTSGFLSRPPDFTQPAILQRMLAALAVALPDLKTRDENDPNIALLDVCAVTLDVLSFYQQQFNQETYLNTATQLSSVRELARTVNYELNPGVAAAAYLEFQIDANANNTGSALIPKGTQIQSIPNQGTQPQSFETSENLITNAAWNQLEIYQPQLITPPPINAQTTDLYLNNLSLGLAEGDVLLLSGEYTPLDAQTKSTAYYQLILQEVSIDTTKNLTHIFWQNNWADANQDLSSNTTAWDGINNLNNVRLWIFNQHTGSFGNNAPVVSSFPTTSYYMRAGNNDWDGKNQVTADDKGIQHNNIPTIWQNSQAMANSTNQNIIYLDQLLVNVTAGPGSWALVSGNNSQQLYEVTAANEVSKADFGVSGRVTCLTLKNNFNPFFSLTINSGTGQIENYIIETVSDFSIKLAKSTLVTLVSNPTAMPSLTPSPIFLTGGTSDVAATTPSGASLLILRAKANGTAGNKISFSMDYSNQLFRTAAIYVQSEELTNYIHNNQSEDKSYLLQKTTGIPLAQDASPALQIDQKIIISNSLETVSETIYWDGTPPTVILISTTSSTNKYIYKLKAAPQFSYQPGTTNITGNGIDEPISVSLDISTPTQPLMIIIAATPQIPATVNANTPLELKGSLVQQSEVFTIKDIAYINTPQIPGYTVIFPNEALQYTYHPGTSMLYGNVAYATHGATITQILGSGDATQANQQFSLQKIPLTYLSSSSANTPIPGIASTLDVKVNDVSWQEAPSLYGLTPNSRNYVLTQEDNGQVTITFGDGIQGARLPTGQENITATYRQGIGAIGNVGANSLILLQTRPQGVISVSNPFAASGGVDPESLQSAYLNAPSGVLTMNRLVSQTDFENYARTQTQISKSRADLILQPDGQPILFITVAGANGTAINDQKLINNLLCNINQISDLGENVGIGNYESISFNVDAGLTIANGYDADLVISRVTQALLIAYGFSQREFAQNVVAGDVIETIRNVPGVIAVDLNHFYPVGYPDVPDKPNSILYAYPARSVTQPAQLLTINPIPNVGIQLSIDNTLASNTC